MNPRVFTYVAYFHRWNIHIPTIFGRFGELSSVQYRQPVPMIAMIGRLDQQQQHLAPMARVRQSKLDCVGWPDPFSVAWSSCSMKWMHSLAILLCPLSTKIYLFLEPWDLEGEHTQLWSPINLSFPWIQGFADPFPYDSNPLWLKVVEGGWRWLSYYGTPEVFLGSKPIHWNALSLK